MAAVSNGPITRDDLERKFRGLQGSVEETSQKAYPYVLAGGALFVLLIALIGYLFGSRRGKKARTVVEIRRV